GCVDQTQELGAPRAQVLDRGSQETAAPQRAGDRTRQQARPHRLERIGAWSGLRGEQASGCVIVKPAQSTLVSTEVCERMRRDGGSVFPAPAKTGGTFGPTRPFR